jgi:hypothetical protein
MKSTKFKRAKIYLGWKVHGRLVAQIAVFWIAYHVIVGGSLFAVEYLRRLPASLGSTPQAPAPPFLESFIDNYAWLVVFPIVVLPILLFDTIRLTHRIVGPLKRLEGVFQRMARGEAVTAVHFRARDLMGGVEEALNAYLTSQRSPKANSGEERESPLDEILRGAGSMVMHNDPSPVDLAEHERKVAADRAVAVEVPVA